MTLKAIDGHRSDDEADRGIDMSKLDHYLALNYHRRLYRDDEGDWIVEIDDLPGCVADGKSPDEAMENSREAMRSWMESRTSAGLDIPEPSIAENYSGRILLRMPKYVHRRLAIQAQQEGSSLNQYIVSLLSYGCAQIQANPVQEISFTYGPVPPNRLLMSHGPVVEVSNFQRSELAGLDEVLGGRSGTSSQAYGMSQGGRA
jgi:antitoxin HicB